MIELTPVQSTLPENGLAEEIETAAVQLAQGAGEILSSRFGQRIAVEYKDKEQRDPVTEVDKACQEYLVREISRLFPEHSILGEEGGGDESGESETPCNDIVWVLDPLDGTTNFLNGLPVFASSIGVLYRGRPLAGAMFVPWPIDGGGFVLHCRRGAGCFAGAAAARGGGRDANVAARGGGRDANVAARGGGRDANVAARGGGRDTNVAARGGGRDANAAVRGGGRDYEERTAVYESEEIVNNRLVGLPGFFGQSTRFGKGLRGRTGEVRTTGSIAYELAMTACGVLQYAVIGAPRMWDMAAGALAVMEAGGTVMTRLHGQKRWQPMDSLVPSWDTKPPTLKELRQWVAPLVAGNNHVAPLVAQNLRRRFSLKAKLRPVVRKLRGRRDQRR